MIIIIIIVCFLYTDWLLVVFLLDLIYIKQ